MRLPPSSLACTVALLAIAPPSHALQQQVYAVGACQSALPAYDGLVRARPRALQNEGGATAFVSCAQPADGAQRLRTITVGLDNTNATAVVVTCTLVVGASAPLYYTQSIQLAARSHYVLLNFQRPAGTDAFRSSSHAFSCQLPPGTGLHSIGYVTL